MKLIKIFAAVIAAFVVLTTCASSPASAPDDLDMTIREASDYLNECIPAGSKIVIVEVESGSAALSNYILDELIANAVNDRIFEVVDRQRLDRIREEQSLQWSGEVDQALEIGRWLEAHTIVMGRITPLGERYRLNISAIEVQTARVQGQNNWNMSAGRTITALMGGSASGGTRTASSGTGGSSGGSSSSVGQTAQTPAQTAGPRNGTYTFWPRPQANRAGVPVDAYLEKAVVSGGNVTLYIVNTPRGAGTGYYYIDAVSSWGIRGTTLENLDNPSRVYNVVNSGRDGQAMTITFQGVTGTRFILTETSTPPFAFNEIVFGEPDNAASSAVQESSPRNGTYTFFPRPRATRVGVPVDAYLEKAVVSGGYVTLYILNTPSGAGTGYYYISGVSTWGTHGTILQNLNNPVRAFNVVNSGSDGQSMTITFQGVIGSRFSLTETSQPPLAFDEIVFDEPD